MTFFKYSGLTKMATAVSALAVCGMLVGGLATPENGMFSSAASAQSGSGNAGGQGAGGQGSQSGQGNQGGQGSGQGGPDASSDGKGPQAGGPSDTNTGGGKPAWAQEGIPEVELGRLSVARSPDQVLDRAYAEALAALPAMADFYNLTTLLEFQDALSNDWDNLTIIDSPLQNLALLRDALDGGIDLSSVGITNPDDDLLMAVFLGVASDKAIEITSDTAYAVSVIFGTPLSESEAEALAADAEAIRIAVLAGHG
jgi:hypothetical protein